MYKRNIVAKTLVTTMAIISILVLAGCSKSTTAEDNVAEATTQAEQMPSPITEYGTLEEAEKAVGFNITAPEAIGECHIESFSTISDDVIQIDYTNDDGREITIRKGAGSNDISGDYNEYEESQECVLDGKDVTLKGNNDSVSLATWTDGEYNYSVSAEDARYSSGSGFTVNDMNDIIEGVE